MSSPFERMKQEFGDKDYRHAYADGFLNSKIATQLKVLREQREWTQSELAQATGMQQARISVLEDVDYSSWSLSTLRRVARAFDLRLDVEFKEFGTLVPELRGMNRNSLERRSFMDDPLFHPSEAQQINTKEAPSEEILNGLWEKVVGTDRQRFWQQVKNPQVTLAMPGRNNVLPFPTHRVVRSPIEEVSNAALSHIAS